MMRIIIYLYLFFFFQTIIITNKQTAHLKKLERQAIVNYRHPNHVVCSNPDRQTVRFLSPAEDINSILLALAVLFVLSHAVSIISKEIKKTSNNKSSRFDVAGVVNIYINTFILRHSLISIIFEGLFVQPAVM